MKLSNTPAAATKGLLRPAVIALVASAVSVCVYAAIVNRPNIPPSIQNRDAIPSSARSAVSTLLTAQTDVCNELDDAAGPIAAGGLTLRAGSSWQEKGTVEKVAPNRKALKLTLQCEATNTYYLAQGDHGWRVLRPTLAGTLDCRLVDKYRISKTLFAVGSCAVLDGGGTRLVQWN